jgi:hypothetical protein
MICYRCGHSDKNHAYPNNEGKRLGCQECWKSRANKSKFFQHAFDNDNLKFLERKANEK